MPVGEQAIQASQLSTLYSLVSVGDRFIVVPIGLDKHPLPYGYPAYRVLPDGQWSPQGNLIYHPNYKINKPLSSPRPNPWQILLFSIDLINQMNAKSLERIPTPVPCGCPN